MFVPRSLLPQFYAHALAPLAFAGALVLSHAALRDELDVFFMSATERSFAPVALLLGVLLLTHALANRVCGVEHKALWPLLLVPVPLVFYELGVVYSPAQSTWVWLLEYGVYLVACVLLLQAFCIGVEHLAKCAHPRGPVTEDEAKEGCNTCFGGSALFGGLLLAFNIGLVLGGGVRYYATDPKPTQLDSKVSSPGNCCVMLSHTNPTMSMPRLHTLII